MAPEPAIRARELTFSYPAVEPGGGPVPVFAGLSLDLRAGECLALMGANGTGKSTFCRLVGALAPQMTGGEAGGTLMVLGHQVISIKPALLAGRLGMTFQEVEHQLFNPTVEAEVAWELEALGLPPAEIEERIRWALDVVGLRVERSRSPAALSGGQQRRLALAVAIAIRPELLVLDEPLGGLDPLGTREVLRALAALRRETLAGASSQAARPAILLVESRPEAIIGLVDRVAILSEGRVFLEGDPRQVFVRVDELARHGVAAPQLARLAAGLNARLGTGYAFLTVDEAADALSPPNRPSLHPAVDDTQPGPAAAREVPPALLFERVSFSYPEGPPVLHAIDLSVPAGQFVALVGANGSGKTTLAKHIIGLLRPEGGRVRVGGQDTASRSVAELARQVGYLFQHPERQIFASTIWDEVAFGPRNLGLDADAVKERVEAALDRFELTGLAQAAPAVLSYALRRLVTLASVAAMDPAILVLDEPTVGLDAPGWATTLAWCREVHRAGRTVLLITHDMEVAAQAERVVVLERGRVIGDGAPAEIFAHPELMVQASLEPPPVAALAQRMGLPSAVLDVAGFLALYA
jgi:energy-coupling factor transporter ATP-binding protein EcfA2